jgi:hypothetical protein
VLVCARLLGAICVGVPLDGVRQPASSSCSALFAAGFHSGTLAPIRAAITAKRLGHLPPGASEGTANFIQILLLSAMLRSS